MREIKFRCWNNLINRMHDPATLNELLNEAWDIGHADSQERNGDEYDHLTWLQYTGLKDKNGKEIYEGDILHSATTIKGERLLWEVFYRTPYFTIRSINNGRQGGTPTTNWFWGKAEVIGNVYENPELINNGNKNKSTK